MIRIYTGKQYIELLELVGAGEIGRVVSQMELMATSFVYEFERLYAGGSNIEVYLFAGPGYKGANTLLIADLLHQKGYTVYTYLFYTKGKISELCRACREQVVDRGFSLQDVQSEFAPPIFTPSSVIIDGLYGVDLIQEPAGGFASLIGFLNQSPCPIVSVDIPSGLFAEDNSLNSFASVIRATYTLTYYAPKRSMLFREHADYVGRWQVLDMGISEDILRQVETDYHHTEEQDLLRFLPLRSVFSDKETYGQALIIGGQAGHYGRLALSAKVALRSGCGEVIVSTTGGEQLIQTLVPESVVYQDDELHMDKLLAMVPRATYAFDSSLALTEAGIESLTKYLPLINHPIVFDGEILEQIKRPKEFLSLIPGGSILVVRPSDFDHLSHYHQTESDRLRDARDLAQEKNLVIVLKGPYTAICLPSGRTLFNINGNAGMATAGVGSVLNGLLVGLLAQGIKPMTAAITASFLLGQIADSYAGRYSMETLTASDLVNQLPEVLAQIRS